MKNLTVNAPPAGNLNSITNNNLTSNANLDDMGSLLDGMFLSELDSASMALLNQMTMSVKESQPSSKSPTDQLDESSQDTDPINLMDAMQLAASQSLIQLQAPQLQNVPNAELSLTATQAIDTTGQIGESLSASTLAGIANQNLLNILNGSIPQSRSKSPVLDLVPQNGTKASILGQVVTDSRTSSLEEMSLNQINTNQVGVKQDQVFPLPDQVSKLSSDESQGQNDAALLNQLTGLKVQENPSKAMENQQVLINTNLKPTDKQSVNEGPNIKVSNLSDALKNMGDVKVLSVDQQMNNLQLTPSLVSNTDQSQEINLGAANTIPVQIEVISKPSTRQDSKEDVINKKVSEDFEGISNGFLLNPSFTNNANHEVSLKLEATNTSLTSGPLHTELISAAKSGGGRISLEVNPDNAGPIRIDLQIDQGGQARLVVQGASESTQARLEQGGDHLREQFAQMGLQLSLDMRQNSANQTFNQQTNDFSNQFSNNQRQQNIASGVNSNRIGTDGVLEGNQQINAGNSGGINLFA